MKQIGFWRYLAIFCLLITSVLTSCGQYEPDIRDEVNQAVNGIIGIEKTASEGLVDTYTVVYTDGTTTTFTVTNGAQGIQGIQGAAGADGHTPVITIQDGCWYIDGVNTQVPATGIQGETGNGIAHMEKTATEGLTDIYTITFTNGSTTTFTVTNGAQGEPGDPGEPGEKGDAGANGKDGESPTVTVTKVGSTITITVTNPDGSVTTASFEDGCLCAADDDAAVTRGYMLQESDLIRHASWSRTCTDTPNYHGESDSHYSYTATRKFTLDYVPYIDRGNTDILSVVFWLDGKAVGEVTYATLKQTWAVDFAFDSFAFNITYNGTYAAEDMEIRLTNDQTSPFDKVLVLGDSISTDYYANYTKWVTVLQQEGFLPYHTTNSSIHATGFVARYTAEGDTDNDFLHRLEAVEDKDSYDLVIVFGGINDFIQSVPLGTAGGDMATEFIPAVDYFFEYLVNNFPAARIVVLTPLRTYHTYPNSAGFYQTEYADYIETVARSYCLPVLDLTEESGFCPFVQSFRDRWTLIPPGFNHSDGVHPNEAYQREFLAPMIRNFLERFA